MANVFADVLFAGKLVEETTGPFGAAAGFDYSMPDITFRASNATVPAAHQVWSGVLALVAGTLTLNLTTSLVRTDRSVLNLQGLRVIWFRIDNLGSATMKFVAAATNPYTMVLATPGTDVRAGGSVQQWEPNGFGTVGAAAHSITVTGNGTDTFRLGLIAGNP